MVVDFIMKFTNMEGQGAEEHPQWIIHTNGSSNRQVNGAGIVIHSLERDEIECMIHLDFPTTNNETENKALVAGLDLAKAAKATSMMVYHDSQVITSQVNGDDECKGERMKKYLEQVRKRVGNNLQAKFIQIPKEENEQANRLVKVASAKHMPISSKVLSFVQLSPLIDGVGMQEIGSESNWITLIVSYLKDGTLPDGKEAARKLKVKAVRFILIKDVLYKRGFSQPYLRCLSLEEADYVTKEVYEGICRNHLGSRSLVHKLIQSGYYCLTM